MHKEKFYQQFFGEFIKFLKDFLFFEYFILLLHTHSTLCRPLDKKGAVVVTPWRDLMDMPFAPAVGRRERVRNPVFLTKTLRNVSSAISFLQSNGLSLQLPLTN